MPYPISAAQVPDALKCVIPWPVINCEDARCCNAQRTDAMLCHSYGRWGGPKIFGTRAFIVIPVWAYAIAAILLGLLVWPTLAPRLSRLIRRRLHQRHRRRQP